MANQERKYLPISEFRERGYLHEVNRLVLHPLGLALEAKVAKEPGAELTFKADDLKDIRRQLPAVLEQLADGSPEHLVIEKLIGSIDQHTWWLQEGDAYLGGIWDSQDDPGGIVFGEDLLNPEKAARVCAELLERRDERRKQVGGWVVQPCPDHQVLSTTYTDPELRSTGEETSVIEPGQFAGVELPEENHAD